MLNHPEQLRWACRRGMLELDLFLVPFHANCYNSLNENEQAMFKELLQSPDPELLSYLMAHMIHDQPAMQGIIDKIRQFRMQRGADTFF